MIYATLLSLFKWKLVLTAKVWNTKNRKTYFIVDHLHMYMHAVVYVG